MSTAKQSSFSVPVRTPAPALAIHQSLTLDGASDLESEECDAGSLTALADGDQSLTCSQAPMFA